MATEQKLVTELVRAKTVWAREVKQNLEANQADRALIAEWRGQEIMAQTLLNIFEW